MAYIIYAGDGGSFKQCGKCTLVKPLNSFYKRRKGGFAPMSSCKECQRVILASRDTKSRRATNRRWEKENRGKVRAQRERWRKRNPDYERRWRERNAAKLRIAAAKWRSENLEAARSRARDYEARKREKPKGRIENSMSASIRSSLKGGVKGRRKWESLVGYTVNDLMAHLERQFEDGMTWENYGPVWHIDHIIPKSVFNYEAPEHIDFKRCWALSNLRPLWAPDNMKKHAKVPHPFQPSLAL